MRWILLFSITLLAASCPKSPGNGDEQSTAGPTARQPAEAAGQSVEVWLDPVLQEPLKNLAAALAEEHGLELSFTTADRGELLELAREETPDSPEVYLFAGVDIAGALREAGLLQDDTLRTFSGDRLVVVQRRDNIYRVDSLFDMYRLFFDHIGLGEDTTTAGYFGNHALVTSGAINKLDDDGRIVKIASTEALLAAVLDDTVQLAIIAASTAAQTPQVEVCHVIDETYHEDIQYLAAASPAGAANPAAVLFLRLIAEDPKSQQLLVGYGLLDRETALDETL